VSVQVSEISRSGCKYPLILKDVRERFGHVAFRIGNRGVNKWLAGCSAGGEAGAFVEGAGLSGTLGSDGKTSLGGEADRLCVLKDCMNCFDRTVWRNNEELGGRGNAIFSESRTGKIVCSSNCGVIY